MSDRPVRFRGVEYPVIERFRIGGRLYLAVSQIGAAGRRAYQVYDTAARTMRALHVLPDSQKSLERIQTLQRLTQGDNEILQILECRREHGSVFVVLPWIDGFNLRSVLSRIRDGQTMRISTPEAVRLLKGVAHALHHIHRHKQIIHGDIKPANLILTHRTSLVLIDYGNAWPIERTTLRHGGDGMSGAYSAPEYLQGHSRVDFRADCFSVGVILYELSTGRIPYDGHGGKLGLLPKSARSGCPLVPVSEMSPERNQIPGSIWKQVDHLIANSLAIEPDDRFETSSSWLDAWSASMNAIQQISQRSHRTTRIVRVIDWIRNRFT